MKPGPKCLALACAVLPMPAAWAAAALENPPADHPVAGISLVSGWHCDAKRIEVAIDGGARILVPSGTSRADTASACNGNTATGFGYLLNWGNLAPGAHAIVAYGDGAEFARRTFTVVGYGADFLRGLQRTVRVDHFPFYGQSVVLDWNESTQSFNARELRFDAPGLAGTWFGADIERRSDCARTQNNGNHVTYGQYLVAFGGSSFSIQQTGVTGLECTYAGTYDSATLAMKGTYSCNDGKTGTLASSAILVTDREMSIQMTIKLTGNESCTIDATVGGSRV